MKIILSDNKKFNLLFLIQALILPIMLGLFFYSLGDNLVYNNYLGQSIYIKNPTIIFLAINFIDLVFGIIIGKIFSARKIVSYYICIMFFNIVFFLLSLAFLYNLFGVILFFRVYFILNCDNLFYSAITGGLVSFILGCSSVKLYYSLKNDKDKTLAKK